MEPINFEDYKIKIEEAINVRIREGYIKDPLGFILIDGFTNLSFNKSVTGSIVIGGITVPGVTVVGKSTGLIYTFALKVLIPDIQI